jgi:hypothetical protein
MLLLSGSSLLQASRICKGISAKKKGPAVAAGRVGRQGKRKGILGLTNSLKNGAQQDRVVLSENAYKLLMSYPDVKSCIRANAMASSRTPIPVHWQHWLFPCLAFMVNNLEALPRLDLYSPSLCCCMLPQVSTACTTSLGLPNSRRRGEMRACL